MDVVAFIFALGLGFGIACWACGTLLDKSNNIGDSTGTKDIYGVHVHFTCERRLGNNETNTFCANHDKPIEGENNAPRGSELVHRLSEEELERYKPTAAEEAAAAGTLRNTIEDEFSIWDSQQPSGDFKGVFKPLDKEE
ncbi:MAG: hypothetical protein IJS85_00470 [Clostridiales bacterium]|nr:hypothetical protein [Clostridiales bacterium]